MRIHYSQEADVLYIKLKENVVDNTDEITEDIIMDYDRKGNVIAIEILSASKKADIHQLIIQAFDSVMVERPITV